MRHFGVGEDVEEIFRLWCLIEVSKLSYYATQIVWVKSDKEFGISSRRV